MESLRQRRPAATFALAATSAAAVLLVAGTMQATAFAADELPPEGYRIGPKDLVEIRVFEVPELSVERRVSENGFIDMPIVGDVEVKGLTEGELADKLRKVLEETYVQRATVAVQVTDFRSRPIWVVGAVRTPGALGFSGRWTLLEALAAAGGLVPGAGDTVHVLRRAENGLTDQISITLSDLLIRADPASNIPIFANDFINVPATLEVTVFCLGEVTRGGAMVFKSTERITVLTAIARAGGLTDRASKKVLIKREGREGEADAFVADYKRIVAGKDPDVELRAGDVVMVKESFF